MRAFAVLGAALAVWSPIVAQAGTARPALELTSTDPLRIRGERFRAYERVLVTARVDGQTHVFRTRTGPLGRFMVLVRTSGTPCTASVRAVGARGSRAELAFDHVICPTG